MDPLTPDEERSIAAHMESVALDRIVIDPRRPSDVYIAYEDRLRLVAIVVEAFLALRKPTPTGGQQK